MTKFENKISKQGYRSKKHEDYLLRYKINNLSPLEKILYPKPPVLTEAEVEVHLRGYENFTTGIKSFYKKILKEHQEFCGCKKFRCPYGTLTFNHVQTLYDSRRMMINWDDLVGVYKVQFSFSCANRESFLTHLNLRDHI